MTTSAPSSGTPTSTASPGPSSPRRRRVRRVLVRLVVVLLVLALVAVGGIAWYFSGLALDTTRVRERPHAVTAATSGSVTVLGDRYVALPGRYGLDWEGGYGTLGPVESASPAAEGRTSAVRRYTPVRGVPAAGTKADVDAYAYRGNPNSALGLEFENAVVQGELGAMPAWYVPAGPATGTWVVFVHGRGGTREEGLRYLRTWHGLGLPVLMPTYRNDVGAPAARDGHDHLGDTEWRDVDSAVRYALGRGARDVVLAGWSMGGAVSLQAADRSEVRDRIRGLLLESPVLDWRDVFVHQGADRGLPEPLTRVAIWTVGRRIGADLDRFDWVRRAGDLRRPVLVLHSDADTYVPDGPAKRVAAARPDLVTLHLTPGAEHTRGWNVDPEGFDAAMRSWLARVGALPAPVPQTS